MENTTDGQAHEKSAEEATNTETSTETKASLDEVIREAAANQEDGVETLEKTDEFKEKYYYLAAEMQNMQKRTDKEKENLLKYGNEKIIKEMLDVVDNLERTLGFIRGDEDEKVKNIVVGIDMIQKMFLDTLSKNGLTTIDAMGKEFDPNFHEALAKQPSEGKKEMEVIQVHQNGYMLNDRVIRAAKVIVAKND